MALASSRGLDRKRLALLLAAFFVAIAAPATVLIVESYRQLEWEAFFRHRVLAEELEQRIDARLGVLVDEEDRRSFADYGFLVVQGSGSNRFVQPSPLSRYPVRASVPGLLGYFQIDADGYFSTPALPDRRELLAQFGIAPTEFAEREALGNRLRDILAENRLVETSRRDAVAERAEPEIPPGAATGRTAAVQDAIGDVARSVSRTLYEGVSELRKRSDETRADAEQSAGPREPSARAPDRSAVEVVDRTASSVQSEATDEVAATATSTATSGEDRRPGADDRSSANVEGKGLSGKLADTLSSDVADRGRPRSKVKAPAQAAFDRLEESVKLDGAGGAQRQAFSNLGRVEELELDSTYDSAPQRQAREQVEKPGMKAAKPARQARKERSAVAASAPRAPLPVASPATSPAAPVTGAGSGSTASLGDADQTPPAQPVRIATFESELDPFKLSLLESGHWVLYRTVWRSSNRYIQGALIDREQFLSTMFEEPFRGTSLAVMSKLGVAFAGNIIAAYDSSSSARRYIESAGALAGALLLRTRLSAPFDEVELIFTATRLPAGPAGGVVFAAAAVLALLLVAGVLMLYRLGSRQIALARQQQDFVSAVSHELKTPLTSIRMYGEMLESGWASEDKKQGYYAYILEESERLSRLIGNVLQLARMSRNDLVADLRRKRIAELNDSLRSKVNSQVERAGFTLELECDEALGELTLDVDEDFFSQIVINLVDNAIKFSAGAERKLIRIQWTRERGERVRFSVRDFGPGVARDQMRKIFRLFYRSENELTRETVGTGIGLALVNELARAMRASVDVVNREPGAEFFLVFRLTADSG